jgi:hypothetical protein
MTANRPEIDLKNGLVLDFTAAETSRISDYKGGNITVIYEGKKTAPDKSILDKYTVVVKQPGTEKHLEKIKAFFFYFLTNEFFGEQGQWQHKEPGTAQPVTEISSPVNGQELLVNKHYGKKHL